MGDVAARAGVDVSVVSRVLSKDPALRVREQTRAEVLRAVEELDYRPNLLARGLRTSRSQMIGLVLPDFTNPVFASIIAGAERAASALDLVLVVATTASGAAAERQQDLVLSGGRLDALLIAGASATRDVRPLMASGVPSLLVNRWAADVDRFAIVDYGLATRIAVEHLASLGHQRIGHLAGLDDIEPSQRRQVAYLSAMEDAGLMTRPDWVARFPLTFEGGAAGFRTLCDSAQRPTAIVTDSVAPALGAIEQARRNGIRIPDDISIVGVNDIDLLEWTHPGLTTVRTPLEQLGELAVRAVVSADPREPIEQVLTHPMDLIIRETTSHPRAV